MKKFLLLPFLFYSLLGQTCPNCVVTNPTTNQTITQPATTSLVFNYSQCGASLDCETKNYVTQPGLIDNLFGSSQNLNNIFYGQSRNVGPLGDPAGQGWTVTQGVDDVYTAATAGISQNHSGVFNKWGAGDAGYLYIYPQISGGAKAPSDEGVTLINFNGTEESSHYHGTVNTTTGTGDIHPTLNQATSGPNHLISQGYLLDTSKAIITGNLTGLSTVAPFSISGIEIGELPVSNTISANTNGCLITAAVNPNGPNTLPASTVLNVPQAHVITCTATLGLPQVTVGHAWLVGVWGPEQIEITAVSGNTFTILNAITHDSDSNSIILQSPTAGCLSFDADNTQSGNRTDILMFGYLNNKILMGVPSLGGIVGGNFPLLGFEAETSTSSYHVYPCALILGLDSTYLNPTLEQNVIPFTANDSVESPQPYPQQENMLTLSSTLRMAQLPGLAKPVVSLNETGDGAVFGHDFINIYNHTDPSHYLSNGGYLIPPAGINMNGPLSSIITTIPPLPSTVGAGGQCSTDVGTFACFVPLDYSQRTTRLFGDTANAMSIDWVKSIYELVVNSGFISSERGYKYNKNETPTAGHYLRANGTAFVDGQIQNTDLPTDLQSGTTIGGQTLQQPAFTGGGITASGSSCTITAITNGVITGATCAP